MGVIIKDVEKGGIAEKNHIRPGETLLTINGRGIDDVLDYQFYAADQKLKLELRSQNGDIRSISIKKGEYDDIGLVFSTYLMDEKRSCRNNCIFCFIDQLPPNMRESLYFKDDDARLSFLMGNYITLTNLTEHDVRRIIDMHISPVNISVHTTNPELRVKMMNNRFAGESLKIIKRLSDANIKINCQLVLCKGINDGQELKRSLNDLSEFYPSVESIAVVPVGLTKYREGLFALEPYDKQSALNVLQIVEDFGGRFLSERGTRLAYAADEFYLKAQREIPPEDFYGEFNQLENGVGLMASLKSEFDAALKTSDLATVKKRTVSMATGTAAFSFIKGLAARVMEKAPVDCRVYKIENNFFGKNVNVAGLVTGCDLIEQLRGKELGDELLIPAVMLRYERDLFLDSLSLSDVEKELAVRIRPVENDGFELLDAITGA